VGTPCPPERLIDEHVGTGCPPYEYENGEKTWIDLVVS
jgi:hypothetical protein